ncbi:hypothetical protein HMPREF9946_02999 [Acetobacteraceae bacterium AT-5844]|nr:hypothetical protein HMPREF9946_02999 [Acetobacteraceae bacterium AT-5844]
MISLKSSFHAVALSLVMAGGIMTMTSDARAEILVTGQGENFSVTYGPGHTGNVVGGGIVEVGSKNDPRRYLDPSYARSAPGLPDDQGGQNGDVVYIAPSGAPTNFAGGTNDKRG